jgi:hypothetical protein
MAAGGTAIAVEQKARMDRGRRSDVCDRTFRWLLRVSLGDGHVPLGDIRAFRAW